MIYSTYGIINIAIIFLHLELAFAEERSCFDNKQIRAENVMSTEPRPGSQVLVPNMTFSCYGTITNLIVKLTNLHGKEDNESNTESRDTDDDDEDENEDEKEDGEKEEEKEEDGNGNENQETKSFPSIQIWRPFNSSTFMTDYYILFADNINSEGKLANVSLMNETIRCQPGDIIGYYIPIDSAYSIQNVPVMGNTSYYVSTNNTLDKFTINGSVTVSGMLPMIQVVVGISDITASVTPVTTSVISSAAAATTTITTTTTTNASSFISDIVTSVISVTTSFTSVVTVTTTNSVTSTTPMESQDASSDEEIGSKSSSSSVVGIVIGCVAGLVLCITIMVFIILFLWCKKKRTNKGVHSAVYFDNSKSNCSMDDSKGLNDHQHSAVNYAAIYNAENGCLATIKNTTGNYDIIDNAHIHIDYDTENSSKNQLRKPIAYLEPNICTNTVKDSSKHNSRDYQSPPTLSGKQNLVHNYATIEAPYQMLEDPKEIPTVVYANTPRESNALSGNEQIYEDPGHKKEVIYSWFEKKKKFRKIRQEDIRLLQQLGSGEFGVVHLGLWSNGSTDPVQVAVKTLNSQCSESDRVKFLREAAIMGQFVHKNVVQLHGVVTGEENIMIILEYMPKGDLEEILMNLKTTISQETCHDIKCNLLEFSRQVAEGMRYLANKQFVHRDLAARNILVSSDDVCKIADFGMARDVASDTYYITSGGKIPLKWTAPEAIFYKKYSTQSDVWSFGCVLYEIWSLGHKPFEDIDDGTEYVEKITTGYRLPPPPGCPRAIYELMIQCWDPVAKHRPLPTSLSQILQKDNYGLVASSVTDDAGQSMMLGEPLAAASQFYLDLQQTYMTQSQTTN